MAAEGRLVLAGGGHSHALVLRMWAMAGDQTDRRPSAQITLVSRHSTALYSGMVPGLVAGALLAFTLSLDDFVITFFTSGPDTITFPIKVYSMVRFSVTPAVNAASTLLILLTAGLTALALWLQGADIAKQAA